MGSEAPDVTGTPYWIECGIGSRVSPEKKLAQARADELVSRTKLDGAARMPPVAITRRPRGDAIVTMYLDDWLSLARKAYRGDGDGGNNR